MSGFQQYLLREDETSCLLHMQPLFTTIVAIFAIFAIFKLFITQPPKTKLPPSPPKLPIIGNLHQIGSYPHRSFTALAQRYGPLMLLHFGKVPVLVVSSSDAAREILKTNDIIFANRPKSTPFEKLFFGYKDVIMAPYGEYWRQIKSICVLQLLSNKRIQSFRNVRVEEVALMIEKIKQSLSTSSSSPINLSDALFTLTNNIVCRVALGRKYSEGEVGNRFRKMIKEFVELTGAFHVGDYIPWLGWVCHFNGLNAKLEKMAKEVGDFHEEVIQEHENKMMSSQVEDDHKDFVDVLLWVQKENKFGFPIDRVTIKALISDMFGAGTDTTFTVLEWALTELIRHPKIIKELQNEVRGIVGGKSDITEDDLIKMNYLKAVIKETMRLHPPIPLLVPRQSSQDVKINGYDIAAGTQVYINYWAISRDTTKWDVQAEEFLPERFLNSSISFQGQDLQFIPFGAGRRSCPGVEFSMRAVELALASLMNEFDWSLPDEAKGQPLDLSESYGLVAHRKSPLIAVATPRSF